MFNNTAKIAEFVSIGEVTISQKRHALAERMLSEYMDAERIASATNVIAEFEGQFNAAHLFIDVLERHDLETAKNAVYRQLVQGANDTWSGRTNDVKRAHHDGFRSFASDLEFITK